MNYPCWSGLGGCSCLGVISALVINLSSFSLQVTQWNATVHQIRPWWSILLWSANSSYPDWVDVCSCLPRDDVIQYLNIEMNYMWTTNTFEMKLKVQRSIKPNRNMRAQSSTFYQHGCCSKRLLGLCLCFVKPAHLWGPRVHVKVTSGHNKSCKRANVAHYPYVKYSLQGPHWPTCPASLNIQPDYVIIYCPCVTFGPDVSISLVS